MVAISLAATLNLNAQCTFVSPTVEISTTTVSGANCIIKFNLSFDLITNSGNKYINIHLWETGQYPNPPLPYGTSNQPSAADLANTIENIVINNNTGGQPVLLTVYSPAPSVPVANTTTDPGLSITKIFNNTPGVDRYIISNVSITRAGACNNALTFKGDAWSSNAASANSPVHCAFTGFTLGITDPIVTGNVTCGTYDVTIATTSASKTVNYKVYIDGGVAGSPNGVFDIATDGLVTTVGPINITPASPYDPAGVFLLPPPYDVITYYYRKLFIVVDIVGVSYLIQETLTPSGAECSVAPILLSNFYAQRKGGNALLTWKTSTEIDAKGFDIERNTANGFVKVGYVNATNNPSGDDYSFQETNTNKGISLYRLKLIDKNGSYKLSENRSIKGTAAVSDFTIFPNPSSSYTKINIADITEATTVEVIDIAGRIVKTIELKNSNSVNIENLKMGIYMVRITNKTTGDVLTKKLTVSN